MNPQKPIQLPQLKQSSQLTPRPPQPVEPPQQLSSEVVSESKKVRKSNKRAVASTYDHFPTTFEGGDGSNQDPAAVGVALWPSSTSKPPLLLQFERFFHQQELMLQKLVPQQHKKSDDKDSSNIFSVTQLRISVIVGSAGMFKNAFRVYGPVFKKLAELVEEVALATETMEKMYNDVLVQLMQATQHIAELERSKHELQTCYDEDCLEKNAQIEKLTKIYVTDPELIRRRTTSLQNINEELKRRIKAYQTRDTELSAALVARSMALDNLEKKLFDLQLQKEDLLRDVDRYTEEQRRTVCHLELAELRAAEVGKVKDEQIREQTQQLESLKAQFTKEMSRVRAQAEYRHKGTGMILGDYDWTELCENTDDDDMYRITEEGERGPHLSQMPLKERITHLAELYKRTKEQLYHAEENLASPQWRSTVDDYALLENSALSTKNEELIFVNCSAQDSCPVFLQFTGATVRGNQLADSDVIVELQNFFNFHKLQVRADRYLNFESVLKKWFSSKHHNNTTRRVAFAYSFLYAVERTTSVTLEVITFLALLHGIVANDVVIRRHEIILEIRAALEKKEISNRQLSKVVLEGVLRKYLTWLAPEQLQSLTDEAVRIGQLSTQTLLAENSTFLRMLARFHLCAAIFLTEKMVHAVSSINPRLDIIKDFPAVKFCDVVCALDEFLEGGEIVGNYRPYLLQCLGRSRDIENEEEYMNQQHLVATLIRRCPPMVARVPYTNFAKPNVPKYSIQLGSNQDLPEPTPPQMQRMASKRFSKKR